MRIIAGKHGGRRLASPKSDDTRPTSDRVREALFSILGPLDGARVLDLYSGTGAIALEAISRGARAAVCVESASRARSVLLENVQGLGEGANVHVIGLPVARALEGDLGTFDVVFADPPWRQVGQETDALFAALPKLLPEHGTFVLEHAARDEIDVPRAVVRTDFRKYGDTALSFFQVRTDPASHI